LQPLLVSSRASGVAVTTRSAQKMRFERGDQKRFIGSVLDESGIENPSVLNEPASSVIGTTR